MDSLGDLIQNKADHLDLAGQRSELEELQAAFDRWYKGRVRVRQIRPDGSLLVTTPSATLASEVRYQQVELLATLRPLAKANIERLQIVIR